MFSISNNSMRSAVDADLVIQRDKEGNFKILKSRYGKNGGTKSFDSMLSELNGIISHVSFWNKEALLVYSIGDKCINHHVCSTDIQRSDRGVENELWKVSNILKGNTEVL